MKASAYEQDLAQTRGVKIKHWVAPKKVLVKDGRAVLRCTDRCRKAAPAPADDDDGDVRGELRRLGRKQAGLGHACSVTSRRRLLNPRTDRIAPAPRSPRAADGRPLAPCQ